MITRTKNGFIIGSRHGIFVSDLEPMGSCEFRALLEWLNLSIEDVKNATGADNEAVLYWLDNGIPAEKLAELISRV